MNDFKLVFIWLGCVVGVMVVTVIIASALHHGTAAGRRMPITVAELRCREDEAVVSYWTGGGPKAQCITIDDLPNRW